MRFIALLSVLCIGLVCSVPVDRESERDVEYVDAGESRREPEVSEAEYPDGDPQRRFPVVILDSPLFRPVDDDDGFDSDGEFYDRPQQSYPFQDNVYRRIQQQLEEMRRLNQLLRQWFTFGRPMPPPRFPPGFFDLDGFGNFSDIPPNYDNSTYTTKNINGTIVSVNETIKSVENNESSFVFHVKTIQVRPENDTRSDDGITVVEGEENVGVPTAEEGNQGSVETTTNASSSSEGNQVPIGSSTEGPVEEFSPSAAESEAASPTTTEGAAPSSTEDPTANDVNLARRFRRQAFSQ